MWALVATIHCQDMGLQTPVLLGAPILALHKRILEESKKRDRRNTCGLLKEIHRVEKCAGYMNELMDSVQFPLSEEKEGEVRQRVEEIGLVFGALKDGLDPLERQVRKMVHGEDGRVCFKKFLRIRWPP